jgi:hypothetical protein
MLLALGFSRNQAAAYLKIDGSSITRACARDKGLADELLRAERMSEMQPHLTVMAEAQKNWRAAAWFLAHRTKHPLPPPPMTEEEKEAQHQIDLADRRRKDELINQMINSSRTSDQDPDRCREYPDRMTADMLPRITYKRRRKKVRGK